MTVGHRRKCCICHKYFHHFLDQVWLSCLSFIFVFLNSLPQWYSPVITCSLPSSVLLWPEIYELQSFTQGLWNTLYLHSHSVSFGASSCASLQASLTCSTPTYSHSPALFRLPRPLQPLTWIEPLTWNLLQSAPLKIYLSSRWSSSGCTWACTLSPHSTEFHCCAQAW